MWSRVPEVVNEVLYFLFSIDALRYLALLFLQQSTKWKSKQCSIVVEIFSILHLCLAVENVVVRLELVCKRTQRHRRSGKVDTNTRTRLVLNPLKVV